MISLYFRDDKPLLLRFKKVSSGIRVVVDADSDDITLSGEFKIISETTEIG